MTLRLALGATVCGWMILGCSTPPASGSTTASNAAAAAGGSSNSSSAGSTSSGSIAGARSSASTISAGSSASSMAGGTTGMASSASSSSANSTATGSTGGTTGSDAGTTDGGLPDGGGEALIAARPYYSSGPQDYDGGPLPMILMLHGYGVDHAIEGMYLAIEAQETPMQFFYAAPDGTIDPTGNRFWNATDACCNFYGSTVDDVAYLTAVIQDMQARYPIDPKRIFIVGHSNGAFMAHRMACDRASLIAGIISLAGAQWLDPSKCSPSEPVNVVELHGTADTTIPYGGGTADNTAGLPAFPSAPQTVATWASKNGCTGDLVDAGPTYDFDRILPGEETTMGRFPGCTNVEVELWSILGGTHIPNLGNDWPTKALTYLLAHPKN